MPCIPGIYHRKAIRALHKAGFRVVREGRKHVVLTDGTCFLTVPRSNPVNAYTMGGIVKAAGLTVEQFKSLL